MALDTSLSQFADNNIASQRCFNHGNREAAARCPECRRFYCRECVTEHDDRMICSACLRKQNEQGTRPRRVFWFAWRLSLALASFILVWALFVMIGDGLLRIPSEFHESGVWAIELVEETPAP